MGYERMYFQKVLNFLLFIHSLHSHISHWIKYRGGGVFSVCTHYTRGASTVAAITRDTTFLMPINSRENKSRGKLRVGESRTSPLRSLAVPGVSDDSNFLLLFFSPLEMLGIPCRGVLHAAIRVRTAIRRVFVRGRGNMSADGGHGTSQRARKKSDLRKFAPTYGDATAVRDSVLTFPLSF